MPTGYTADVGDGKVTDFRDFAMQCARAFGACVVMRDDPWDKPIPVFQPDTTYFDEMVARAQKALIELPTLSAEECEKRATHTYADQLDEHRLYARQRAEKRRRYEDMIRKVQAWSPPTSDHMEMKSFMLEQLRTSIECDCSERYCSAEPERQSGEAWRAERVVQAERDLAYGEKHRREEIERTDGRNKWVADLRASLVS